MEASIPHSGMEVADVLRYFNVFNTKKTEWKPVHPHNHGRSSQSPILERHFMPKLIPILEIFATPLRLSAIMALLTSSLANADIQLPAILSDHMVLAKRENVTIWGKADPGEKIAVTLNTQTASTSAAPDGRWRVGLNLKTSPAGPFEMTVEGKSKIIISDVLVGEVWVASGQSNMTWNLQNTTGAKAAMAESANPMIRQFKVKVSAVNEAEEEVKGSWVLASPESTPTISAIGYYFARQLQKELQAPIGIINSSVGGTHIEAWTSPSALNTIPDLKAARDRQLVIVGEHPGQHKNYVEGMGAWIKAHAREDRPVADSAEFAGMDVSTEGWVPVRLPGRIELPGFGGGALWIRKDVEIKVPSAFTVRMPINGFDSVYWNGRLLAQTTYETFPGTGNIREAGPYHLPEKDVKAGRNVLAVRIYQPASPATVFAEPKAGALSLSGKWLAKLEFSLPALDEKILASEPAPPASPPRPPNVASSLFLGMIDPLLPFAISGVIWYQGEANVMRAVQYQSSFPLLISDWREQWQQGDFPFYFCQLANYLGKGKGPGESTWAELREAQSKTLRVPNTGQAVTIDIGESADIHPRNKKDVGERLALIALARHYGREIPYSGPVFDTLSIDGGKAILTFQHAEGGLAANPLPATYNVNTLREETAPLIRNSPNSQLEGFAICGEDKVWVWADAAIEGDRVVVWSDTVSKPVAVRYAWSDNPTCNLFNAAGLPASPFRTDDFPLTTLDGKFQRDLLEPAK
jgi:sialate O-acetylesterase